MAADPGAPPPDLATGIQTYPMLDAQPPAFRVSWVRWDSPFRATGLQPGDLIVAVAGEAVAKPEKLEDLQHQLPMSIGQYDEPRRWREQQVSEGTPIALTVQRRRVGGVGWETLEVKAPLARKVEFYQDAGGRRLMAPEGPEADAYSQAPGADGSWMTWYEDRLVSRMTSLEEDYTRAQTTRYELSQHLLHLPRLQELNERFPGPFAATAMADWVRVRDLLAGTRYEIGPADLDFRKAEDERVAHVAELAKVAWQKCLDDHAKETIAAFPAPDPLQADRAAVAGKLVVLPPIENRNWVTEAIHNYFAVDDGSPGGGLYIGDAECDASLRMLRAARRYERRVGPNLSASYQVLGRVLADPRLLVMQGRALFGLQFEPVAALVGEAMFVDLTRQSDGESLFEGEAAFNIPSTSPPPAEASPQQVMQTLVAALKAGDQATWNALFATFWVSLENGKPMFHPGGSYRSDNDWSDSRRIILGKVFDVRVAWTSETRQITSGKEFDKAPHVEEVTVQLDHVGLFDGEYRAFQDVGMNLFWTLQRVDAGPWRITSSQSI